MDLFSSSLLAFMSFMIPKPSEMFGTFRPDFWHQLTVYRYFEQLMAHRQYPFMIQMSVGLYSLVLLPWHYCTMLFEPSSFLYWTNFSNHSTLCITAS
jgi:hypothetical protein